MIRTPLINVGVADLVQNCRIWKAALARLWQLNVAAVIVSVALIDRPVWGDSIPSAGNGCQGVVFVLNGAGTWPGASADLDRAVAEAGLNLAVVPVHWSHGFGRALADQTDWDHAQDQGHRLADQIVSYRQNYPGQAVYLVAHSAGSGVALTAAAAVPPGSVDRMILLAPAVSTDYDLRPALRCTRNGIDVFYSHRDLFTLGLGVRLVGTSNGCRGCPAAGRVGFCAQIESSEDAALYAKLRQFPWERGQRRFGNRGFHSGSHRPRFLQAFVLPLLNPSHSADDVRIVRD
jgi:pimeloyl-ACP methyl ester carboxylesterase